MLQGIGMLAVALGIIGIIYGFMQKLKAGRVADAPMVSTSQASQGQGASPKGAISAQGKVNCPQPLIAPFSGTPCLFYELKVTARWKEGDHERTKEIDHQKAAAPFAIDDGSGPVQVDASKGGDFEPSQVREETKSTGLIGGITGQELVFGSYRLQTGMLALGTKYTVREDVLPVQPHLYACGKSAPGAITSPDWRQLLLSNKSRDDMLAAATKGAKTFLIGGAAAFVGGILLAALSQIL
jgi:hypothetical protein